MKDAAQKIIIDPAYQTAAGKIARECTHYDAPAVFRNFLLETFR